MEYTPIIEGMPLPMNPEERSNVRVEVCVDGWVCSSQVRKHYAALIDISVDGCRVRSPFHLQQGCTLIVRIADLTPMHATVRWSTNEALGLKFTHPLDARIIDRIANLKV